MIDLDELERQRLAALYDNCSAEGALERHHRFVHSLLDSADELIAMARRYQFLLNEIDRVDVPPIGRVVWKLFNDRESCKWTDFATSEDVNAAIDAAMQEQKR